MSDFELLQLIARGQTRALESLVEKYQAIVFGLAQKYLNNWERAEDMAQDVWIKVVESAHQFAPQSKSFGEAKPWLMTITRNMCLNQLKSAHFKTQDLGNSFELTDPDPTPAELFESLETKANLKKVISTLEDRERALLTLFLTEERSLSEISEIMNLSISNVKVILHRTRDFIRREMKSHE